MMRRTCLFDGTRLAAQLLLLSVSCGAAAANAQTAPPGTPSASATASPPSNSSSKIALSTALKRLSDRAGLAALADSTVSFERVPAPLLPDISSATASTASAEAAVENALNALVKSLPAGTIWGKLYLPAPPSGRSWRGDDVSAFAFTQARLFGNIGKPASDGSIEILGERVSKEAAPSFIAALKLRPVYIVSNTRRQMMTTPWSAASQEQWAQMSPGERKVYGQQQAEWIYSLPPEQREQMLEQIRQHDKYFDTVKDPLEKLLGHDL